MTRPGIGPMPGTMRRAPLDHLEVEYTAPRHLLADEVGGGP